MVSPEILPTALAHGDTALGRKLRRRAGSAPCPACGGGSGSETRRCAPRWLGDGLERLVQNTQILVTGARRDQEQHELKRRHLGIDADLLQPPLDLETGEAQPETSSVMRVGSNSQNPAMLCCSSTETIDPVRPGNAERNASARSIVRVQSASPSSAS